MNMLARFALLPVVVLCVSATVSACAQEATPAAAAPAAPLPAMATDMTANAKAGLEKHLNDWAQLKRYAADNAALAEPAKGEKRVVFYGDSITDGWGRRAGSFFPGKPYVNRGISGQTTPQMVVRFRQDVINLHPAAVVILAGTNDIAGNTGPETLEQIEDNFRSMTELAWQNNIRVVLASVLPTSRFPWHPDIAPAETVRTINAWLKDYAASRHEIYLDYYSAMVADGGAMKPELATDKFVHPND